MSEKDRVSIVFAKVNIEPSLFTYGQDPKRMIEKLFSSPIRVIHTTEWGAKKSGWVISDNRIVEQEGKTYAVGKLGRLASRRIKVFNVEDFTESEEEIPKAYVSSHFVLSLEDGHLVFEEVSRISVQQFCEAFADICQKAEYGLGFVSVFPFVEPEEYSRVFRSLAAIRRVRIELVQPNPGFNFILREITSRVLLEPDARHAVIDCETPGVLKKDSGLLVLAERLPVETPQYGSVTVTGVMSTNAIESITVSSFDNAVKITLDREPGSESRWKKMLEALASRLRLGRD